MPPTDSLRGIPLVVRDYKAFFERRSITAWGRLRTRSIRGRRRRPLTNFLHRALTRGLIELQSICWWTAPSNGTAHPGEARYRHDRHSNRDGPGRAGNTGDLRPAAGPGSEPHPRTGLASPRSRDLRRSSVRILDTAGDRTSTPRVSGHDPGGYRDDQGHRLVEQPATAGRPPPRLAGPHILAGPSDRRRRGADPGETPPPSA